MDEPNGRRMASVVVRAALETEKGNADPRFDEYRSGRHIFLSLHPDLKTCALRLGQLADKPADEDRCQRHHAYSKCCIRLLFQLWLTRPPPVDNRLLQLAVLASDHAAISAKLEIYPRGLSAERALALAQNALVCPPGNVLSEEEVRKSVAAKYPKAQPKARSMQQQARHFSLAITENAG